MDKKIELSSGFIFDFFNMFADERLDINSFYNFLQNEGTHAYLEIEKIRKTGMSKSYLYKDKESEPVYFLRMPYIKEGNPNTKASINKLKAYSKNLRNNIDAIVFLGIGGSYLGCKLLFDVIAGEYWNEDDGKRNGYPRIYFSGNNLDTIQSGELAEELQRLSKISACSKSKFNIMLVPISKSGTTLETIIAFMYFYDVLMKSSNIKTEVTLVTDLNIAETSSPLLQLADKYSWERFDIPKGIGGRFSVFANPGLIMLASIGADIELFLFGARELDKYCQKAAREENPALVNASIKYLSGLHG